MNDIYRRALNKFDFAQDLWPLDRPMCKLQREIAQNNDPILLVLAARIHV